MLELCPQLLLFAYPMLGEIMRFIGNHIHFRGKRGTQAEKTAQLLPHYKVFEERLVRLDERLPDLVSFLTVFASLSSDCFSGVV